MPTQRDHRLPLAPDWQYQVSVDKSGSIDTTPLFTTTCSADLARNNTWMLAVRYKASSRWKVPAVTVGCDGTDLFTQYFEPGEAGRRLINLTGIHSLANLKLTLQHMSVEHDADLLGFQRPDVGTGPMLIIAPHPDDAELAAFGLYRKYPENTWIVTLTAGERLKRLDKQYWPELDDSIGEAAKRKGFIRAWNSATTPLLAGVPANQLIMLGYFNDTLAALQDSPDIDVPSYAATQMTPDTYRRWNKVALPSDGKALNTGQHLQQDLAALLDQIKPATIITPHPEVDPHPDHIASTRHLVAALHQSGHIPVSILLYANHLKSTRGFPRGPVHAAAGVWPLDITDSAFGDWKLASFPLSLEGQKQKALALHSMHDLGGSPGLERRLKRRLLRRLGGIPMHQWKEYGAHDFFQTHIKAHENYIAVTASTLLTYT